MRGSVSEEATEPRAGGLPSRIHSVRSFVSHPAFVRIGGLAVGLAVLGAIGRCASSPAAALPHVADAGTTAAFVRGPPPTGPSPSAWAPPVATDAGVEARGDSAAPPSGAAVIVDLNAATEADLRTLPGIGARRARAILELRDRLGGFRRVEDLARIRGIGRAAVKRLRPLVRIGPVLPKAP